MDKLPNRHVSRNQISRIKKDIKMQISLLLWETTIKNVWPRERAPGKGGGAGWGEGGWVALLSNSYLDCNSPAFGTHMLWCSLISSNQAKRKFCLGMIIFFDKLFGNEIQSLKVKQQAKSMKKILQTQSIFDQKHSSLSSQPHYNETNDIMKRQ